MKSEAAVQREVVRYLKALGYRVWRVGQRNARGTQDAGVSDLIVFGDYRCFFLEIKRADGKQRPDQREFQRAVESINPAAEYELPIEPTVRYAVVRSLADVDRVLGVSNSDTDSEHR